MQKTRIMIVAVALIAAAGMFAQNATRTKKGEEKNFQQGGMPPFQPPKIERPSDADLKAYHDAEAQSYKILLDAQVKAKMVSQEWADARLATLKALQADCKGQCFFFKTSHIYMADKVGRPFFGPRFHKHRHGRHDSHDCCVHGQKRGHHGPKNDHRFERRPSPAEQNKAEPAAN